MHRSGSGVIPVPHVPASRNGAFCDVVVGPVERPNIVFASETTGGRTTPDTIRSLLHNSSSGRLAKSRKEPSLRREDSRAHSPLIKCANGAKLEARGHKLTVCGGREVRVQAHFFYSALAFSIDRVDCGWQVAPSPTSTLLFHFPYLRPRPRRSFISYPHPGCHTSHLTTSHVSAPMCRPRPRLYAHADPPIGPRLARRTRRARRRRRSSPRSSSTLRSSVSNSASSPSSVPSSPPYTNHGRTSPRRREFVFGRGVSIVWGVE